MNTDKIIQINNREMELSMFTMHYDQLGFIQKEVWILSNTQKSIIQYNILIELRRKKTHMIILIGTGKLCQYSTCFNTVFQVVSNRGHRQYLYFVTTNFTAPWSILNKLVFCAELIYL